MSELKELLIKVLGFLVMALLFLASMPILALIFILMLLDKVSDVIFKLENKGG